MHRKITDYRVSDLEKLAVQGEDCDQALFSEMRTNLQLVAGNHWVREGSKYWQRIRDNRQLTEEQKLKLTKNHIQRIVGIYQNGLERFAPGVGIYPHNETELQDQKAAEMHSLAWEHIKTDIGWPDRRTECIKNFTEIGEVCAKVFWDPDKGSRIGYMAQMVKNEQGEPEPLVDPVTGDIVTTDRAQMSGAVQVEVFPAYQLKRSRGSLSMDTSPWLLYTKLVDEDNVLNMVKGDEKAARTIKQASKENLAYDMNTGRFQQIEGQCVVKEMYFKPCAEAPDGYFYIWAAETILAQGPIPHGCYPIIWKGWKAQTGHPRCYSVIRDCRPNQIEINRSASKVAEHQITVGDDKVWIHANQKITQGALLPGVRVNYYTGQKPEFTQGRTGDQYLEWIKENIDEMYLLAELEEFNREMPATADLYTQLFQRMSQRERFVTPGKKIEGFFVELCKLCLKIFKYSAGDEAVIKAIGRDEQVNIDEFRNTEDVSYQIKLEPQTEDVVMQMGKQITINSLIQFAGTKLERNDIGKLARLSPFLNKEQIFDDFTIDYDNATNDILALDRGKYRPAAADDDHDYFLKRLTKRTKQPDFEFLPYIVQSMYAKRKQEHEYYKAVQLQKLQLAQSGFIPSGGYRVKLDFYTTDPATGKTSRLELPSETVGWVMKKLEEQQGALKDTLALPGGTLTNIADRLGGAARLGAVG